MPTQPSKPAKAKTSGKSSARAPKAAKASKAIRKQADSANTTARFWLGPEKRYFGALLDFIMVSPNLAALSPRWRIWHPQDDPALAGDEPLAHALLTASDHFPVTLDLPLG